MADPVMIDAVALKARVMAKAEEYHGRGGDTLPGIMNAGRVDGYWTVAAWLQEAIREAAAKAREQ